LSSSKAASVVWRRALTHHPVSGDFSRAMTPEQRTQAEFVTGIHTLPEQAAEIFNLVKPKLAVYAHAPVSDDLLSEPGKPTLVALKVRTT